jgi:hypothetical protein
MVDGEQRPVLCGTFRPEPGVTYYDFRAPATAVTTSAAAADGGGGEAAPGFRVTDEADAHPNAPGAAVYEAR